ncbi:MAG: TIGR04222 domain-containing membrane protein, partial [Cyanobacteriota bacterium]
AVILVGLLALGIAKIGVGISRGRPVGFLVMMCLVLSVAGLCFLFVPVHRSRYGDQVLQEIRSRIPSAPVRHADPQLPLAFALLGAAILPTDTFADLKQMFTPVSSGGDGGGGCGGGGCGGGCGGCGG